MSLNPIEILTKVFGVKLNQTAPKSNYKNEDKICVEFQNEMKCLLLENKLNCLWFHVANEGAFGGEGFRPMYGEKLKRMGKAKGMFDYIFLSQNGSAMIEFKYNKNKMTPSQVVVKDWADKLKIHTFVAYSAVEAIKFLKQIKFIKD
jgi:hypothetical protein